MRSIGDGPDPADEEEKEVDQAMTAEHAGEALESEVLEIPSPLADEMIEHCRAGRPNEACGIIAGAGGRLTKVFKMTNAAASPVRYSLEPKEQLAVYNTLEDNGWELAGVFHSHTRTEPLPSPTDIRLASEDVPYVIVSLATDDPEIRAWRIRKRTWTDEEGEVEEVPVVVTDL
ncbi:MAG TPA: M67 family metallopeptidase [Actinomycetota bacterium]|nr:M67 family metallopeptidase [Actinomycetota bacterium]